MSRQVSAVIESSVRDPADVVFAVAVARGPELSTESLEVTLDGAPVDVARVDAPQGTVLHLLRDVQRGSLRLEYAATLAGPAPYAEPTPLELVEYLRPSRYAESDRLFAVARSKFAGVSGIEQLAAVRSWVGARLAYVSGSSRHTDGAVDTYLARAGVCRDYAHLVIALLRALDVPARLAAVYAPGLSPMDFHAIAEAYVEGAWRAVDATGLAPRQAMVRIATGRDAADTAFMSVYGGRVDLGGMWVTAVTDGDLPVDDHAADVQLS